MQTFCDTNMIIVNYCLIAHTKIHIYSAVIADPWAIKPYGKDKDSLIPLIISHHCMFIVTTVKMFYICPFRY